MILFWLLAMLASRAEERLGVESVCPWAPQWPDGGLQRFCKRDHALVTDLVVGEFEYRECPLRPAGDCAGKVNPPCITDLIAIVIGFRRRGRPGKVRGRV